MNAGFFKNICYILFDFWSEKKIDFVYFQNNIWITENVLIRVLQKVTKKVTKVTKKSILRCLRSPSFIFFLSSCVCRHLYCTNWPRNELNHAKIIITHSLFYAINYVFIYRALSHKQTATKKGNIIIIACIPEYHGQVSRVFFLRCLLLFWEKNILTLNFLW